jgi:hypothetical protein
MRGRNRKGPNPLTRSFESNGPDVKIRGTALHIAEKYVTLARDAQSSGDRVMAENYLQHAEHYFRVIAAAQAQNAPQQPNFYRADQEDDGLDEEDDRFSDRFGQHERFQAQERMAGEGEGTNFAPGDPQPYVNGNGNGHYPGGERQPYRERSERQEGRQDNRQEGRPEGSRQEGRPERYERQDRERQDRDRQDRPERGERPYRQREDRGERRERPDRSELPRFVTGEPVPQPAAEAPAPVETPAEATPVAEAPAPQPAAVAAEAPAEPVEASGEETFRPRRRRTTRTRTRRAEGGEGAADEPTFAIDPVGND